MRTRNLALFLTGKEEEGATLSAWGWSKKKNFISGLVSMELIYKIV